MIITLVIASAGIYFGYQFLKAHLPLSDMDKENVFKGEFVVIRGDFIPVASDGQGLTFVPTEKSRFYQLKLDQILSSSPLSSSFLFNEILLLEGLEGSKGVRVHFNVHMSPQYRNVTSDDIYDILKRHIEAKNPTESFLAEVEIDVNSLHIEGKITQKVSFEKYFWRENKLFVYILALASFWRIFSKFKKSNKNILGHTVYIIIHKLFFANRRKIT